MPSERFFFRPEKAVQAAALLIRAEGGRTTRLRLLKLLYVADRRALQEKGRPITGDKIVAMEMGPVLSETYNLIKRRGTVYNLRCWDKYIASGEKEIALKADPGTDDLSDYEVKVLESVARIHQDMTTGDTVEAIHSAFPEWRYPGKTSRSIPLRALLAVLKRKDVDRICREAQEDQRIYGALRA